MKTTAHIADWANREPLCGSAPMDKGVPLFHLTQGYERWPWLSTAAALQQEYDMEVQRAVAMGYSVCEDCSQEAARLLAIHRSNEGRVLNVPVDPQLFEGTPSDRKVSAEWREWAMSHPWTAERLDAYKASLGDSYDQMRCRIESAPTEPTFMSRLFEMSLGPMLAGIPRLEARPSFWESDQPDYTLKWRSPSGGAQTLILEAKRLRPSHDRLRNPAAADDLLQEMHDLPGMGWQACIEEEGCPIVQHLTKKDKGRMLKHIKSCVSSLDLRDYPGPRRAESLMEDDGFAPQAQINIFPQGADASAGWRIHFTFAPSTHPDSELFAIGGSAASWLAPDDFARAIRKARKQFTSRSPHPLVVAIGQLGRPDAGDMQKALFGEVVNHVYQDFSLPERKTGPFFGFNEWLNPGDAVWRYGKEPRPLAVLSCPDALDGADEKPILWCPPHGDAIRLGPMVQNDVVESKFLSYQWSTLPVMGGYR